MADSRRKAPSSQPWKYVSRIQAAEENRQALDTMARAAKERLATNDVRGARDALAQASPNSVRRNKDKGDVLGMVSKAVKASMKTKRDAELNLAKKSVATGVATTARNIATGKGKLSPEEPNPSILPRFLKKTPIGVAEAGLVGGTRQLNEMVSRRTGTKGGQRLMSNVSGETFQEMVGIDTSYFDRLREKGIAGEMAAGAIDAAAPAALLPGIGPFGSTGGASVLSKVGAKILARKVGAEAAAGAVGYPAARIASEQAAEHTDNPWIIGGVALGAGLVGGVGGYTGVDRAGNIARAGVRGAKAADRAATAADAALLRKYPKLGSAEAGEFRMGGAEEPSAIPDPPGTRQLEPGEVRAYHYTSAKNAERIRKEGLTPQAEGNSAKTGEPAMVWGYEEGSGPTRGGRPIPQDARQVVVEYITRPEEGDFLKPGTGQVASTRAVPPEDIIAVHESWQDRYRAMVEYDTGREELEGLLNISDKSYVQAAQRRLAELDAESPAASFDPDDTSSYFDYAARAQDAKPPVLEGEVTLGREWDQEAEMAKAEQLFEVNPQAGRLLPGVKTPKDWVTLQRKVFDMALAGEEGKYWYERSAKAILAATNGNADDAEKIALLIANFSPKAEPAPNMNAALRAWNQWTTKGVVEGVGTTRMDTMANRIMSGEKLASNSGPKTNSFYINMIGYIKPELLADVATVDRHMGTTYGIVPKAGSGGSIQITPKQYQFIEQGLREIGRLLGWTTDQVQAAVWVVEKSRKLTDQALDRALKTVGRREQKMLDAPSDKVAQSLEEARAKVAGLEEVASQPNAITGDSLYDFADALEERMVQVAWETAPSKASNVLPGYYDAPLAQRMEFHRDMSKVFLDENGNDLLAQQVGLLEGGSYDAPGLYYNPKTKQLEINPGTQTRFPVPKSKATTLNPATGKMEPTGLKGTIDPEARKLLDIYSAVKGYINRQDAVPWNAAMEAESAAGANGQALSIGRTLTTQEAGDLHKALGGAVAIIPGEEDGAWLINLPFGNLDNKSFKNLVEAKVKEVLPDDDVELAGFKHDGEYPENHWHWKREKNGEGYSRRVSKAGGQAVWDWANQVLEPRAASVRADYAERYGWDAPTQLAQANNPAALSGETGSISAGWAAQLAGTAGGAAYGYSTGDDAEDRWKKALSFGVAGAVGGTTLRLAAGGMGGKAKVMPGATPTPKTSVLASLPEEAIEGRQVIRGGRERIIPKVGHTGADEAIAIKTEVSRAQGRISQALPPVLLKGAALLNPAKVMDLPVLVAWRARQATKARLMGEFNTQMTPFVEALEGMHAQVIYTGPEPEARIAHIVGTWKDIFDRPEMYTMTPAAREAIDDLEAASWDFVSGRARAEYGVEVMPYTAQGKPDFAYLPTVARKADMDDKLDSAMNGISTSRRAKRRGYQTAAERMMEDADFEPETDLRQLVTTLNEAMAQNAGDAVLKRGAGGKALAEVIDELHPGLRKQKLRARANMVALTARAKEATLSKNRILRETHLSDTELRAVEARMAPITDRVNALTEADEFGIELSYLSGQQRELEILRAKIMKNIETKEGRAAWQDVRYDKALSDIEGARTQVEDLMRAYESAGTGTYQMDPGTHKWYSPEAAKTMQKLLSQPAGMGKGLFSVLDEIRAWHLAGDFSPLTIQGVLGVIIDPLTAWKALRQVNGDPLKVLQRIQDEEFGTVSDFSFHTGRRFGLQMPDYYEMGAGAQRRGVGRIPGVGRVEDTMFAIIQVMQYNQWKNDRALLQGWNPGMSDALAGQEAASTLGKLVPGLDPGERGISATRGAVERAAVTSMSFVAAPALAAADAGTGYLKLAKAGFEKLARSSSSDPRSAWQTLSGREQLAIRRTFQAAGTVMGLAATSAALSAQSRNMSVEDAIRETWDTDSRYFMAVQLGEGRSIPIGGPFRSAIKAIAPDRNGVPFGNLPSWVGSKVNATIHAPFDVIGPNKDFMGDQIYEGNIMRPENLLRAVWYGSEAVMPIAVGEASESIRKGDRPLDESAMAVVTQFAGTNYTPVSPSEKLNEIARGQYDGKEFYDLLPKEQDKIKKANPSLWNQAVAKGSDQRQQAEALKAEVKEDQEADDKLLLDGELSLDDWEKGRSDRQNQLVGAERAIYSDTSFTGKNTNKTLQKYYDAIDDATTNGRVDWDEVQAWRDSLSEKENRLIDENTGLRKTKLEKLRSNVSKEYYELPRYRGYTADEARDIDAVWQEVRNNSRSADDANMLSALRRMDTDGIDDEVIRAVRKRIIGTLTEDTARSRWARAHPEVAIIQRQGTLTPDDVEAIEAAMR